MATLKKRILTLPKGIRKDFTEETTYTPVLEGWAVSSVPGKKQHTKKAFVLTHQESSTKIMEAWKRTACLETNKKFCAAQM